MWPDGRTCLRPVRCACDLHGRDACREVAVGGWYLIAGGRRRGVRITSGFPMAMFCELQVEIHNVFSPRFARQTLYSSTHCSPQAGHRTKLILGASFAVISGKREAAFPLSAGLTDGVSLVQGFTGGLALNSCYCQHIYQAQKGRPTCMDGPP